MDKAALKKGTPGTVRYVISNNRENITLQEPIQLVIDLLVPIIASYSTPDTGY